MKYKLLLLLFTTTLISCQSNNDLVEKLDKLNKKVEKLEKSKDKEYKPGLGTLMNAIQIHHLKLWKSATSENWELANFEIHELEERFADIEKYKQNSTNIKSIKMIYPQLEDLEKQVKEKNKEEFIKEYELLTATCNTCHKLNEHPFIEIAIPNSNNENQVFTP